MAERRARGSGSVYELDNGRWRGEVQIRGDRTRVYGDTEAETDRLLQQAISDLDAGRARVPVGTINEVLDFYTHRMLDAGRTSSNRLATTPTINLHRWAIDRVREAVGGVFKRSPLEMWMNCWPIWVVWMVDRSRNGRQSRSSQLSIWHLPSASAQGSSCTIR